MQNVSANARSIHKFVFFAVTMCFCVFGLSMPAWGLQLHDLQVSQKQIINKSKIKKRSLASIPEASQEYSSRPNQMLQLKSTRADLLKNPNVKTYYYETQHFVREEKESVLSDKMVMKSSYTESNLVYSNVPTSAYREGSFGIVIGR